MEPKNNEIPTIVYSANGKALNFSKPRIMAVVNLTPDSFFDGGKYDALPDVLSDVESKIAQGAEIIDLGAASSRPGAEEISAEEEWRRLQPVLAQVARLFPRTLISVDTYRSQIALKASEHGADIINDIGGGNLDHEMFNAVARNRLIYVLMHMDGNPRTMGSNEPYDDVCHSVMNFFSAATGKLRSLGFGQVILDPGFGFGKSLANNYQLLKTLPVLRSLGFPLLAGISRKSMINRVIGTNPVTALNGTTVLHTVALLNGASLLRVHDVKEAREAIELISYYKKA
jgi:dihydropteroate synthase